MAIASVLSLPQDTPREGLPRDWFIKAFRSSPDSITISTLEDGRFIEVNDAFLQITGYRREEVIGKTVAELRYWHKPEQRVEFVRQLKERGLVRNFEVGYRGKRGRLCYGLNSAEVFQLSAEPCIVSVLKDITDRKQAEEALRESEEFSSRLLASSPSPIVVINPDSSIRYVNPALERLTGYSYRELVGRKCPYPWVAVETGDELGGLTHARLAGVSKAEECLRKKHGETIWVETTTVAVKSRGKVKYYLANWVDVTEQRQRRENLEFYITEVTRAQEEERKRVARELHDGTIQALSCLYIDIENVIAREGELSERAIQGVREISNKIDSAIEEARRFSHELRPALLDRFGLIPSLELLVKEFRKSGGFDCSLEIIGSERRLSPEAELALFRIAQEALHNVKKHAAASRASITVKFTETAAELAVSDNGKGFKPPTRLSDFARVSKLGVTGMNERAHLLGGTMSIDSEPGKGTTIVTQVPA